MVITCFICFRGSACKSGDVERNSHRFQAPVFRRLRPALEKDERRLVRVSAEESTRGLIIHELFHGLGFGSGGWVNVFGADGGRRKILEQKTPGAARIGRAPKPKASLKRKNRPFASDIFLFFLNAPLVLRGNRSLLEMKVFFFFHGLNHIEGCRGPREALAFFWVVKFRIVFNISAKGTQRGWVPAPPAQSWNQRSSGVFCESNRAWRIAHRIEPVHCSERFDFSLFFFCRGGW